MRTGILSRRRATTVGGTLAVATLLAACGDARLNNLAAGISRDSALKAMGTSATGPDSLTNVYQEAQYFSKGQALEVLLYPGKSKFTKGDSIPEKSITPLVVINGKLAGWGWTYWDSVAGDHRIPRFPNTRVDTPGQHPIAPPGVVTPIAPPRSDSAKGGHKA